MSLRALGVIPLLVACSHAGQTAPPDAGGAHRTPHDAALVAAGEALFTRTWTVDDPVAGGDGLGPLYNADSCVACHRQGGPGGSGPRSANVQLLVGVGGVEVLHRVGLVDDWEQTRNIRIFNAGPELIEEPVFIEGDTEFHTFDTFQIPGELVERNTPSLRTLALIAAVPDEAIRDRSTGRRASGRRSEDPDGRLRRLGWKATQSSVEAFVAQACAVEVGLSTSETPQADIHGFPDEAAAVDLDAKALDALTAYVLSLEPATPPAADPSAVRGEIAFEEMACAECHIPDPGGVRGLYTDLLLHDMGPDLADLSLGEGGGGYGLRRRPRAESVAETGTVPRPEEWRTPPLMEVSRTGPWLHDGRADSLDAAIRMHDGVARTARLRYEQADPEERSQLLGFLATL